ncbi:class I SAM-dependent methyltransferase [Methyloraptor flagellatus]|uniref:Cyclopropane-fatty-acyl-phospholipid synthase family protein n=1 Tax=Methyloraptor flagellatus TaxID=3162530 RepID=A0AAU7XC61_9HYPH
MAAEHLLERALRPLIATGRLDVVTPDGSRFSVGSGDEPRVTVRLADGGAALALIADPELKFGELFTDGRLVVERGTVYDLLRVLLQDNHGDRGRLPGRLLHTIRAWLRPLFARNGLAGARHNVEHHYDLDRRLYSLFLDDDLQYSCAYFEHPDATLDEAQRAKKRHVAAKLGIEPGMSVLDIGCGWGGLALYLADVAEAGRVRGITLSKEQAAVAAARVRAAGLQERIDIAIEDYRATQGTFDRIVSVGMFEHVGRAWYDAFFRVSADRLADDGVMLLHTIGLTGRPNDTNPWITRYIFPGGHLPTLSEMLPAIERSGLAVTDIEVLRLHYAETLRMWRERFLARRDEALRLTDERFCRMWECYLAMSEAAFRFEDVVVFQVQLAKRNDVLPITRDYIADREARYRAREAVLPARPVPVSVPAAAVAVTAVPA